MFGKISVQKWGIVHIVKGNVKPEKVAQLIMAEREMQERA